MKAKQNYSWNSTLSLNKDNSPENSILKSNKNFVLDPIAANLRIFSSVFVESRSVCSTSQQHLPVICHFISLRKCPSFTTTILRESRARALNASMHEQVLTLPGWSQSFCSSSFLPYWSILLNKIGSCGVNNKEWTEQTIYWTRLLFTFAWSPAMRTEHACYRPPCKVVNHFFLHPLSIIGSQFFCRTPREVCKLISSSWWSTSSCFKCLLSDFHGSTCALKHLDMCVWSSHDDFSCNNVSPV